jgi:hypothetical protein
LPIKELVNLLRSPLPSDVLHFTPQFTTVNT